MSELIGAREGTVFFLGIGLGAALCGAFLRAYVTQVERPVVCELLGLCSSCGYDLTGNTSGVCPECGREIERGSGPEGEESDAHPADRGAR